MRAERHRAACVSALFTATKRILGRAAASAIDLCVCTIVLLAFDERLHVDRRHQPDLVTALLGHTTPVMRRRTSTSIATTQAG